MLSLFPPAGRAARVLPYLGLLLIVGVAYYPGLFQPARADQLAYLYTTKDKHGLFSLTLGSYSWNREMGEDIHFFRPILVFVLGVEQWAFAGVNFFAWQVASLLLHMAVVLLLFRWLRGRHEGPGLLPFITAAFFGVQYASMELVAWHHLSGYLLFSLLLVAVFCTLDRCRQEASPARQAALVLLLLLAAFTLEIGNVLALLVAGYMGCVSLRQRPFPPAARTFHPLTILASLAVPALYAAVNLADQYYRYGRFLAGPAHEGCLSPWAGLVGMASAGSLWLQAGLLPSKIDLGLGHRMTIMAVHPTFSRELLPQLALGGVAVFAFLVLAFRSLRQGGRPGRLPIGLVALLFAGAYTAILVFLRAGPRGLQPRLANHPYYAYIFNLSLLVFLSALLGRVPHSGRLPRAVLGSALAVLALLSAVRVHAQGTAEAQWGEPIRVLVAQVQRLRAAGGGLSSFTFAVAPEHPANKELPFVGSPDANGRHPTVAQVLFPRSCPHGQPMYLLCEPYRGYDLLRFHRRVWGLRRTQWPRNLAAFPLGRQPLCFEGRSVAEVELAIDRWRSRPGRLSLHARE